MVQLPDNKTGSKKTECSGNKWYKYWYKELIIPCWGIKLLWGQSYLFKLEILQDRFNFVQQFLTVCLVFFFLSKQKYGCQCLGSLMGTQPLIHAIAQEGCTDTVRESALKVDFGRKIPCHTRESNLPQQHACPMCNRATSPTPEASRNCESDLNLWFDEFGFT